MNGKKKGQVQVVYIHLFSWLLLICYETLVSYSMGAKLGSAFDYVGHYSLNIALFYCHAFWVLETTITAERRYYVKLVLLIILEAFMYILFKKIMYMIFLKLGIYHQSYMPSTELFIMQSIWRIIYFMAFSTAYWFALYRLRQAKIILRLEKSQLTNQIEKEAIVKELLVAENLYLKTQINPHFLFNTLSFIHNQVYKLSETAGEAVAILADIMRYSLNQISQEEFVELRSEIGHIENYIIINQYRFNQPLKLDFKYDTNLMEVKFIPLLLITIVENVFKYAELVSPRNQARVSIDLVEGNLQVQVNNDKRKTSGVAGTGIGMANVKRRLAQHYKDQYILIIDDTESTYNLYLSVKVK